MKRPDKIKVACFDITIEDYTHLKATVDQNYGRFSSMEMLINIDPEIKGKIKEVDTLIHEINHAIYWAYGIEDADKEERIVGTFATAWTQVYRDNPELLAFITESLK
jgi:hypothetical protein